MKKQIDMAIDESNLNGIDAVLPILVIGISGATWSIINPLIVQNKLPHIKKLLENGSYGELKSAKTENDKHYRPQTAWPSFFTGVYPEKHGITKFYHTSDELSSPTIWDYFIKKQLSIGLYGLPMTWPVSPIPQGFIVPSSWARDDATWPPKLSYIRAFQRFNQRKKLNPNYLQSVKRLVKSLPLFFNNRRNIKLLYPLCLYVIELIFQKRKGIKNLLLRKIKLIYDTAIFFSLYKSFKPQFSIYTNLIIDFISHRYWRYHEPIKFNDNVDEKLKTAIESTYILMDKCIAHITSSLSSNYNVLLLSEHGMAAELESNELGEWQYLINGYAVKEIGGFSDEILTIPLARWIVYKQKDNRTVNKEISRFLQEIIVVETQKPLFQVHIYNQNEVIIKLNIKREFYDKHKNNLGNLHIRFPNGKQVLFKQISHKVGPRRSAMHHEDGVFIMKGPNIKKNYKVENAHLVDLMPTILHASRIHFTEKLDGRKLDIFRSPE